MAINIEAQERKSIPVKLVGKAYNVYLPKTASAIKIAKLARKAQGKRTKAQEMEMVDSMLSIVDQIFSKKDAELVKVRLDSPEDALDLDHVIQLYEALAEYAATDEDGEERPTT